MKITVLSYNVQLMRQGDAFLGTLLEREKADFYCLQRVSKGFVDQWDGFSVYQSQFRGCAYGTAILSRAPFSAQGFNVSSREFQDNSQGHAVTVARNAKWTLVNVLPPFEEPPDVNEEDFRSYLKEIFALESSGPLIWVGDFHREMSELTGLIPDSCRNYSSIANFLDRKFEPMNLTKLVSNVALRAKEQVLEVPTRAAVTHLPVVFEIEMPA